MQVNSTYPTGPEQQTDEPFPGTIMRTTADAEQVGRRRSASRPTARRRSPGRRDGGEGGGAPGLPEVPGLPTAGLHGLRRRDHRRAREEPEPGPSGAPGMPEELAALVDFTGYTSTSSAETGTDVVTHDVPLGARRRVPARRR